MFFPRWQQSLHPVFSQLHQLQGEMNRLLDRWGDQGGAHGPPQPTGHGSTPQEVAEATRRGQEAQDNGKTDQDREDHLVRIGRGQQTHG